jgi:hypothetical protein
MQEITYLESDQDFEHLIPLIRVFSERAKVPYWQQLNEVTASFTNPNIFVIIGKDEGRIVGYICGSLLNQREFYISQLFSPLQAVTPLLLDFLEKEMRERNVKKLFGLSRPDPRVFEKYGFKTERVLMSKQLEKEKKEESK